MTRQLKALEKKSDAILFGNIDYHIKKLLYGIKDTTILPSIIRFLVKN